MELRLMTFNVQHCENYVTREIDYCLYARVMLQYAPDVIGVNEIYEPQATPYSPGCRCFRRRQFPSRTPPCAVTAAITKRAASGAAALPRAIRR